MKRNAMRTNLRQSIIRSLGRYIAICLIIGLGAGLFMGLQMSKTDMLLTGQDFMDKQQMFDLRMVSNYGWGMDYPEKFEQLEGVKAAEGVTYLDLIAQIGDTQENSVYRFYAIPEKVNRIALRGGRMPERADECLIDGYFCDDSFIGKTVVISEINDEDSLESMAQTTFTIVGYLSTPLYMDMNRGTTSVGSGSLENYLYLMPEAFDVDYYTEINLRLEQTHTIYSRAYNNYLDEMTDLLEPEAEKLSQQRFTELKAEIEEEYDEGYQEYLDGLQEYEDAKLEVEQELADALQELQDGEQELKDSRQKLINGGRELETGKQQLEEGRSQLVAAQAEVDAAEAAARPQLDAAKAQLDANYDTVKAAYDQANAAIAQAQGYVDQAAAAIPVDQLRAANAELQSKVSAKQAELADAEDEAAKAAIQAEIDGMNAQIAANNAALAPYEQAVAMLNQVKSQCQPALDAMAQINAGYAQLEAQEKQLADAKAQVSNAWTTFYQNEVKLIEAEEDLNIGWGKFHDGEKELEDGWKEYEEGKLEAEQELADAEAELKDAEEELADAREEIDSMDKPDLIILDRTSNVGYNNLESASDIVAGVSKVLPVFFLAVASLVCITTMTRMIDEERTQIGTLKALGYSSGEIMAKYLIYSGSGAVLGCSLGLVLGCTLFPSIIWNAYQIMLYIQPDLVLGVKWWLCAAIILVYTALMLFVTWYSCHKTLEEEPAELIRPKAPDPGKKILLEYLPFWKHIKFLNKVTLRNIFRYRQRMAMMLLGIGGCTALLLTGFGLQDSLVNLVSFQFEDVAQYDMTVYFREALSDEEKKDFEEVLEGREEKSMLYYQTSVELEFDDRVKELYLVSAGEELTNFIDFHKDEQQLPMPGENEVLMTVGVCENLGIEVGDRIILRNADLQELSVTVCGIYDNHVENYAVILPGTLEQQWGEMPEPQMAFVCTAPGEDTYALSAAIMELDTVMNVAVSQDLADMVGGLMSALDMVIVLIVVCAGLLATIVLYNLTNININERIREIATIKVLGFNASETGAYVFKENMILTVAGSLFGLLLGEMLLAFVMDQIKIDMVWFKALIEPSSYLWSVLLTLVASVIVDFLFYFKLDKINMAEALKSVE